MKKGILYFGVSCLMLASLASCGGSSDAHDTQMKAGLIALHTSDSTYMIRILSMHLRPLARLKM